MSDIYDQHDKAFARVSAFVIAKDGERVATVALKYPADGAGRFYAYVHWLGNQMVRGSATGYGYDKRTAACSDAARRYMKDEAASIKATDDVKYKFWHALEKDSGEYWDCQLEAAGFQVWQAV